MLNPKAPFDLRITLPSGKALAKRAQIGMAMAIQQSVSTTCRRLSATDPALALVLQGRKTIRLEGREITAGAGTVFAFPAGFEGDIINEVAGGNYRAVSFYFAPEILALMPPGEAQSVTATTDLGLAEPGFQEAILSAVAALGDEALPDAIASHRAAELLLWLGRKGFCFARPKQRDLAARVADIIASAPERDWQAKDMAAAVGMSEATLRRKLAKAGKSLTDLLLETRMTTALVLLQAGDQPVTQVSYAVGYDSPSRFAMRFRQRFGFSPSDLRKAG